MQLNDYALVALIRGLQGSKADTTYIPQPTSSLLIEFYNTTDIVQKYDPVNYFVKMYLDDKAFEIEGICTVSSCKWSTLSDYLATRTYKNDTQGHTTLQTKCFSHLPVDPQPDNKVEAVPWWLALVISVPLAVITIAIIKIGLVVKDKKKKEREMLRKEKSYVKLEK